MKYDAIVVGGGPSGMMTAITAAQRGKKILLLERMEKLGKRFWQQGMADAICPTAIWMKAVTEENSRDFHTGS